MSVFGKSNGGGRRKALRAPVPMLAVVSTLDEERRIGVVNVSRSGVQLSSPDLPAEGEAVIFQSESVQAFGRVAWSRAGQCGIAFEGPISAADVERLREEARLAADLPFLSFRQIDDAA